MQINPASEVLAQEGSSRLSWRIKDDGDRWANALLRGFRSVRTGNAPNIAEGSSLIPMLSVTGTS
jgi:hypothetical protein